MKYRHCKKIMRYFCDDLIASTTARTLSINRNAINTYFNEFRIKIPENSIKEHSKEFGIFDVDESPFGARRILEKKRAWSRWRSPRFWLTKFIRAIQNCFKEALMPVIQGKILEGSTIHTYGWSEYDGLILKGYDHYRAYHSQNEFALGKSHVNGIESFWSFSKSKACQVQ